MAGSVQFAKARQRPVHADHGPHAVHAGPVGKAGAFLATIFGQSPSATVREDLRRFKQFLEAGKYTTATRSAAATAS